MEEGIRARVKYAFNTMFDPDEKSVAARVDRAGIPKHDTLKMKYHRGGIPGYTPYGATLPVEGFDLFLLAPVSTTFIRTLPEYILHSRDARERNSGRTPNLVHVSSNPTHLSSQELAVSKKGIIVEDLSKSFPGAASSNTVLFSVYNPEDDQDVNADFDFPMGVGPGMPVRAQDLPARLRGKPYVFVYVGRSASEACLFNFVDHVTSKYGPGVSVVMPDYAYKNLGSPTIRGVTFVTDVFPLTPPQFAAVMKHSLPDVLLTGNQSVSDVISCCDSDKTLWYQGDLWTAAFGHALNRYGGVQLCDDPRDTAGSLTALKRDWDFETRAKTKLMNIITKTERITRLHHLEREDADLRYEPDMLRILDDVGIYAAL